MAHLDVLVERAEHVVDLVLEVTREHLVGLRDDGDDGEWGHRHCYGMNPHLHR
jgi:hypothetical protein